MNYFEIFNQNIRKAISAADMGDHQSSLAYSNIANVIATADMIHLELVQDQDGNNVLQRTVNDNVESNTIEQIKQIIIESHKCQIPCCNECDGLDDMCPEACNQNCNKCSRTPNERD